MQDARTDSSGPPADHPAAGTLVIADDLSGAAECASEFSLASTPTELRLTPGGSHDRQQVTLWDLDAREVAASLSAEQVQALRRARRTYIKIDSLMRGRWAELVASCVEATRHPALLCTALPRLGRGMRAGAVELLPSAGNPSLDGRPSSAFDALTALGLSVGHLPLGAAGGDAANIERLLRAHDVTIVDAGSNEELLAWAEALERLPVPYLAIGSAGLAGALAHTLGIPRRNHVPPVLPDARAVLVGSRTQRAREQLACLEQALEQPVRWWDPGAGFGAAAADRGPPDAIRIYATTSTDTDAGGGRALADAFVRATLDELGPVNCFVATGGETARALCEALGVARLQVLGQVEEGISLARLPGPAQETFLILKSGSFGDPAALLRMARLGRAAHLEKAS